MATPLQIDTFEYFIREEYPEGWLIKHKRSPIQRTVAAVTNGGAVLMSEFDSIDGWTDDMIIEFMQITSVGVK